METIKFSPIGTIYTPFTSVENMPIQPIGATGVEGSIILNKELADGLKDIKGFSHLFLIYHLNKITGYELNVVPYADTRPHGVFATRSPKRPNAIGLSIVKLIDVKGNILIIEDVDMLNETPLLDIKPFLNKADNRPNSVSGWCDSKAKDIFSRKRSDSRFTK